MNESMLDVLDFLFDNYIGCDSFFVNDEETITTELQEAGFCLSDIHKAFNWLGELSDITTSETYVDLKSKKRAMRIFSAEENIKLPPNCRGFLLEIEMAGLLEPWHRELILERVMALDAPEVSLSSFKTIIGLVLINQEVDDFLFTQFEEYLYDVEPQALH